MCFGSSYDDAETKPAKVARKIKTVVNKVAAKVKTAAKKVVKRSASKA